MAWVSTEAVRTQSRELVLGDSLSEFMRALGVYSNSGRVHTRLRNQMNRLFHSSVEQARRRGGGRGRQPLHRRSVQPPHSQGGPLDAPLSRLATEPRTASRSP